MKKKLLAAFMAACLAIGSLAACGGSSDKKTGGELSEETETLKMIMLSVIGSTEEANLVEDEINKIIEPQIHAKVEMEWVDLGEYYSTIIARLASGEKIDVLPTFGALLSTLTGQEALMDITDLLADYGQDITGVVGADYMKAGEVNGVQYAVPTVQAYAQENALIYRTDIAEELGLDFSNVKSLADLTPIFEKVHAAHPELTLIAANNSADPMLTQWDWDGLGDEYGVLMNPTESTTVVDLYETAEYKNYCKQMREWYLAGYVMKDAATTSDNLSTIFETGQYFGTIAKDWPGNIEEKFATSAYPFASVKISDPVSTTNLVTGNVLTIPSSAEHPEKAMAFINLLYTNTEIQNLLNYGIEGKHYRLVDGKTDYLEGEFIMTAKYVSKYHIGDYTLSYEAVTDPDGIHKTIKEYNTSSAKSKALGFTYNSEDVVNELTAIATVCAKYRRGLEAGSLDPDTELPKFIQELKDAGIDTVVEEKQNQLNEWLDKQ